MYGNLNILTDDECTTLLDGKTEEMGLNFKYEICAGKKHPFPNSLLSFQRKKKRMTTYKKEVEEVKKLNLAKSWMPTKFRYTVRKTQSKFSLQTGTDYPYDWFIGGVDACSGDSGGPLWRNIKVYMMWTIW